MPLKAKQVRIKHILDFSEHVKTVPYNPNLATSILHEKWAYGHQRIQKPQIIPHRIDVGYD
jgi:hypothetical protein